MNGYTNEHESVLRWEIEALFAEYPGTMSLYDAFAFALLRRHPETEVRPKKTQVGFFSGCGYAWASPPLRLRRKDGQPCIVITLGLPVRLDTARVLQAVEPYPGRWTHHFLFSDPSEIDDELLSWIDEAHAFALARRRRGPGKGE